MRILEVKQYPAIPRTVVTVVENPEAPKWVHPGGAPAPANHTGDTTETGKTVCGLCILNHRIREFVWTGTELQAPLNKFGNPAKQGEDATGSRAKTLDELYDEMDKRAGEHITFGQAPREAAPAAMPEEDPASRVPFRLVPVGQPFMEGGLGKLRYKVLRFGAPKAEFVAEGRDSASFAADLDAKIAKAHDLILEQESQLAEAKAITG